MAVATGPVWFQLYVFKDRAISASLVKRAEVAGCKAIVFTVDVPLLGRRGTDVLKAIACGAHAVFIGRPVLWGLASGAEAGVSYVLEMVRQEFDLALALSGCPTLSSITRDLIRRL